MRENVGYLVKGVSDHKHKELLPDEVYEIFKTNYVDITAPLKVQKLITFSMTVRSGL